MDPADGGTVTSMADLLAIYLNDHLAGATVALELARRARGANEGSELGAFLGELGEELEHDRETLREVMATVGAGRDRLKVAGAWAGEKAGRLKLNGRLLGYSPLSRVVELEGLALAVTANLTLWRMLDGLADARLAKFEFNALAGRAERRRDELERHQRDAGRLALTPTA
jgi:hypothetical protein